MSTFYTRVLKGTVDPLALLLKETVDLQSAQNELRWLKEHIQKSHPLKKGSGVGARNRNSDLLHELCVRRSKGEPLQYILGSQPFGGLDINCRPGVLIPRPETEAYTAYLSSKIRNGLLDKQLDELVKRARLKTLALSYTDLTREWRPRIRILDACSGSGCISLLTHKLLSSHFKKFGDLRINGFDISDDALKLSYKNLKQNILDGHLDPTATSEVHFMKRDVLNGNESTTSSTPPKVLDSYHIIVSNPPYISRSEYETEIPRSVREWEPESALVPPTMDSPSDTDPADVFYLALIKQYETTMAEAFMLVMEIGDEAQAKRVLELARRHGLHESNDMSVWRDSPDVRPSDEELVVDGTNVPTEGQGNARAVVFVRHLASICWEADESNTAPKPSACAA